MSNHKIICSIYITNSIWIDKGWKFDGTRIKGRGWRWKGTSLRYSFDVYCHHLESRLKEWRWDWGCVTFSKQNGTVHLLLPLSLDWQEDELNWDLQGERICQTPLIHKIAIYFWPWFFIYMTRCQYRVRSGHNKKEDHVRDWRLS